MAKKHSDNAGTSDAYMASIRQFKQIDVDEEARLADVIQHGSPEDSKAALDTLVCANLRLVVKIAHDFKRYGLPFNDLVSEGNLGLITAARKFDASKGAKFSCYAAWWIKQSMRRAISMQSQTVRVPCGSMQHLYNVYKARNRFVAENLREPTLTELQELTGYSAATLANLSVISTETVSLEDQLDPEENKTFGDVLGEEPAKDDHKEALKQQLSAAMRKLTPLERHLLSGMYGLDGQPKTSVILAQELGLSLHALNERLQRALDKLRELIPHEDFTLGV